MKEISTNNIPINPTRLWGDTPLFRVPDALELIKHCEKNYIAILGIEGFRVKNEKLVPDMDYIVDFSELSRVAGDLFTTESLQVSKLFVQGIESQDIYLEFLLVKC